MISRISKDKVNFNILKEIGYIILLVTFFIGILWGALEFKSVDSASFEQYMESMNEKLQGVNSNSNLILLKGLKIIAFYWIVGMSIVGLPILIGYLGYKGYSLGYTISAIIKLLGVSEGNKFVFKYLFINNSFLIFTMIFLTNISIKIARNFSQKKIEIKSDALKYTVLSGIMLLFWICINFVGTLLT